MVTSRVFSRSISSHFGTNHIEVQMSELSDIDVEKAFEFIDTPIIDSSILPTFKLYNYIGNPIGLP